MTLLATIPLCFEYESVCHRPEHDYAAGLDCADVKVVVDAVVDIAEPVEIWRPQLRNPGDELVLEAAVNGREVRRPSTLSAPTDPRPDSH